MDLANVFTSLLPTNSDHVMIHLRGYNYAICHSQQIACEYTMYKLNNGNIPNELSHNLNWVKTTRQTHDLKIFKRICPSIQVLAGINTMCLWQRQFSLTKPALTQKNNHGKSKII